MRRMARHTVTTSLLDLIRTTTSDQTCDEALTLFAMGGVTSAGSETIPDGAVCFFDVLTSPAGYTAEEVTVVQARGLLRATECSCPSTVPCVHEAAALLALDAAGALQIGDAGTASGSVDVPVVPPWRQVLDEVLPPVREEESPVGKLCLFVDRQGLSVRIRPGEKGRKGGWIKGTMGWDRVPYARVGREVAALLEKLYEFSFQGYDRYGRGYGFAGEWLPLEHLDDPQLWEHLRFLRDAGVELLTWEGRVPVDLSDAPAALQAGITEGPDAALRVAGELTVAGEPVVDRPGTEHLFLGNPATTLAVVQTGPRHQQITLHRITEPVTRDMAVLADHVRDLQVTAADRAEFESDYLPRIRNLLAVTSPDGSYTPPEPRRAVLVIEVSPVLDEAEMLTGVRLAQRWDRSGGVSDRAHEDAVLQSVRDLDGPPLEPVMSRHQAVPFLAETLPQLLELDHVRVEVTAPVPEFRRAGEDPTVTVRTAGDVDNDWFDLRVTVSIAGEDVNFADLFRALTLGEPLFILPSGTYFPLDIPEFDQLRRIIDEARTLNDVGPTGLRISRYQVDMWEELVRSGLVQAQDHAWWQRIRELVADGSAVDGPARPVPSGLAATLRDYQVRGYRWLETLRRNRLGGILADDMGLGKTLQVIAMMLAAQEDAAAQGEDGTLARVAPFLVVAPTSVVGNWVREIERFAPGLRARAVTETSKKRRSSLAGAVAGADVVVTSYTLFRLDIEEYHALNWSAAVFDEAQMIKNHTSRAYAAARVLDTPVKIAVTGTPLENNLLELWALASLVCPGLLGSKAHFTEFFRHPVEKQGSTQRLALLQRRLRPFLLRRTKDMVAADLPAKTEKVLELQLSPTHRRIYDVRLQRERAKVLGLVQDLDANRFEVFRSLTLLRQLALDSELAGEAPTPSAKLSALAELLTTVTQEGHKVLVLSQFTRFLRKARDAATAAGIDSLYLDGATRNRQQVIDAFRGEADGDGAVGGGAPVFFISLKAGGFGLNLTEADYVVLLDPWWNPATEAQAVDRAHRIGQTRPVVVYRLVSANTIESKVMALKETKAALFDRVLDGGGAVVDGETAGGGAADRAAVGGGDIGRALDAADIRELLA
jgi:superfamily II DNA or RNA helicase